MHHTAIPFFFCRTKLGAFEPRPCETAFESFLRPQVIFKKAEASFLWDFERLKTFIFGLRCGQHPISRLYRLGLMTQTDNRVAS
jgi:hypothetical protein